MAATFDNGIMRFYVNGVPISTTNSGFSMLNACTDATMQIGSCGVEIPNDLRVKLMISKCL